MLSKEKEMNIEEQLFQDAQQPKPIKKVAMESMQRMIMEAVQLHHEISKIEKQLKEKKSELRLLIDVKIPDRMTEASLNSFKT